MNSLLILNRRRFLSKHGLDDLQSAHASGNAMKVQAVGLLMAVQYLKVCLRKINDMSSFLFHSILVPLVSSHHRKYPRDNIRNFDWRIAFGNVVLEKPKSSKTTTLTCSSCYAEYLSWSLINNALSHK